MKTSICVTLKRVGFHRWADAPSEVAFLQASHRHIFTFKLWIDVEHDDRDHEFFIEQRKMNVFIEHYGVTTRWGSNSETDFGEQSCEMLAKRLIADMGASCKIIKCEVFEDDENGACVEVEN